ncbi:hypothetical protein MKZ38_004137 [Zalerion maritima]|uniref:RING-type domain-containing protein n=1 Tax=Zalerion maritima TaxID=339359 RepID=A0AAD5WPS5_9PEZI|nr:hypothetical protein MKZ38_004137 [Zalerion maritima]
MSDSPSPLLDDVEAPINSLGEQANRHQEILDRLFERPNPAQPNPGPEDEDEATIEPDSPEERTLMCAICHEDFPSDVIGDPICTPCDPGPGHIFCEMCLARWFNTRQGGDGRLAGALPNSCPYCRCVLPRAWTGQFIIASRRLLAEEAALDALEGVRALASPPMSSKEQRREGSGLEEPFNLPVRRSIVARLLNNIRQRYQEDRSRRPRAFQVIGAPNRDSNPSPSNSAPGQRLPPYHNSSPPSLGRHSSILRDRVSSQNAQVPQVVHPTAQSYPRMNLAQQTETSSRASVHNHETLAISQQVSRNQNPSSGSSSGLPIDQW